MLFLILFLCLMILPVYYKTKRFDRFWGVLLFILGFGALFLRFYILRDYPFLGFFRRETIISSFLLTGVPAAVFIFFGIYSGHFWRRIRRLEKLLLPYILFGAVQQIFFFGVFGDTVYYLTRSVNIAFWASLIYIMAIHLKRDSPVKRYRFLVFLFSIVNTWIYLIWGNILPQMLLHGMIGSILFTEFTDRNEIKDRLG